MNIHQRRRIERLAALAAEQADRDAQAIPAVVTKADLGKMGKDELEGLGRSQFGIELDKRKTKAALIKEILKAQD
tara:strand:- start:191 stop:415 length:225 start_codon:yes stop_codon:yes gene_type:complete